MPIALRMAVLILSLLRMCHLLQAQVIDAVLANPEDKTELSLVYANVSEADIILKEKIDALAAKHPKQFKVRRRGRGW